MTGAGDAVVRTVLDTGGAGAGEGRGGLVRRSVEAPAGARFAGAAGGGGELWFVIAGTGRLTSAAGPDTPVRPDAGVWLPPGARYRLDADGPGALRLDAVSLPADAVGPGGAAGPGAARAAPVSEGAGSVPGGAAVSAAAAALSRGVAAEDRSGGVAGAGLPRLAELRDCPVEVTGDRRFRVLFGPGNGCEAATQFVGEIPPGRAPEHSHAYDEVVLILDGEGVLHAGPASRPLGPGSCVHLPPGRPHCLENTGRTTLRVLGVFHPGGSPAAKRAGRS
jgi:mannose-6-phosphate isomerase-like protein (cupin superfamily)